jgi:hypothetical protein
MSGQGWSCIIQTIYIINVQGFASPKVEALPKSAAPKAEVWLFWECLSLRALLGIGTLTVIFKNFLVVIPGGYQTGILQIQQ